VNSALGRLLVHPVQALLAAVLLALTAGARPVPPRPAAP
jgi:hypothetical protein